MKLDRVWIPALLVVALVGLPIAPALETGGPRFPALSLGEGGFDVATLQLLLMERGIPALALGLYDEATREQVRTIQLMSGLPATGVADDATWAALTPTLSEGSAGLAVAALQKELQSKHNLSTDATGVFGPVTRTSLAAFQTHMGLPASGVADEATWRALVWHYLYPDLDEPEWCAYYDLDDEWGTASLVWHLQTAAQIFGTEEFGPVAVGDISLEHGGDIDLHKTHEVGLDVDLRLIRKDQAQCTQPCRVDEPCYDRAATRKLVDALVKAAHGHIVRIYLNDPPLYGHHGVVRYAEGHEDHMHVRYCAAEHPNESYAGCEGASPSAVPLSGADAPPEWLPYRESFDHGVAWDFGEEIVQGNFACFAEGLGVVEATPEAARSGAFGLSIWANPTGTRFSDHVYALKRLHDAPLDGRVRYEVHARIDPATAATTQTGPEIGVHTTRLGAPGIYLTSSAGFQYLPSHDGGWQIWVETALPGRAQWLRLDDDLTEPLVPGVWYQITLDVDFTTRHYTQLRVRGGALDIALPLDEYAMAEEPKAFLSEGVVISVEAENGWTNCGVSPPTSAHVDYDDVALTRRP